MFQEDKVHQSIDRGSLERKVIGKLISSFCQIPRHPVCHLTTTYK